MDIHDHFFLATLLVFLAPFLAALGLAAFLVFGFLTLGALATLAGEAATLAGDAGLAGEALAFGALFGADFLATLGFEADFFD